jgi:hypothetical protein
MLVVVSITLRLHVISGMDNALVLPCCAGFKMSCKPNYAQKQEAMTVRCQLDNICGLLWLTSRLRLHVISGMCRGVSSALRRHALRVGHHGLVVSRLSCTQLLYLLPMQDGLLRLLGSLQ